MKKQPVPFGKYFLLDRINIGGMAEVWKAKTYGVEGFEKIVAIKRILPNIAEDEEFITMFIDEAKISVQLTHANIAQTFDLGKILDSFFIAMEYISGKDLRAIFDRLRRKGEIAPIPMTCYIMSRVCEGLDYAHRKRDAAGQELGIVHRDVSPQNVLISFDGEVKVIDFGIAKAANKATKTQAGILKGKFGYMSPEQVRGLPLDRRSDVFALGVVLYELLTGERLFVSESDFSTLEKVRNVDILPPTTYNRRIPESLEKIVLKGLAKDVEDRYQGANELQDDLQRFLITSDAIFGRKDLAQFMRSTFAEDLEREKVKMAEAAEFKLPPHMAALAAAGAPTLGIDLSLPPTPVLRSVSPLKSGTPGPARALFPAPIAEPPPRNTTTRRVSRTEEEDDENRTEVFSTEQLEVAAKASARGSIRSEEALTNPSGLPLRDLPPKQPPAPPPDEKPIESVRVSPADDDEDSTVQGEPVLQHRQERQGLSTTWGVAIGVVIAISVVLALGASELLGSAKTRGQLLVRAKDSREEITEVPAQAQKGFLVIVSVPLHAELSLDGNVIKPSGIEEPVSLDLDPGLHTVVARAPKMMDETKEVYVKANDRLTLTLQLRPEVSP